ncbi:unknown [Clostridium sp. CAG:632]|nr:unknown [Clostridium sp. CAG:632]
MPGGRIYDRIGKRQGYTAVTQAAVTVRQPDSLLHPMDQKLSAADTDHRSNDSRKDCKKASPIPDKISHIKNRKYDPVHPGSGMKQQCIGKQCHQQYRVNGLLFRIILMLQKPEQQDTDQPGTEDQCMLIVYDHGSGHDHVGACHRCHSQKPFMFDLKIPLHQIKCHQCNGCLHHRFHNQNQPVDQNRII